MINLRYCKGCETELEDDQETFQMEEFSDDRFCLECFEDLKDECPRCSGTGCDYCLMCDY